MLPEYLRFIHHGGVEKHRFDTQYMTDSTTMNDSIHLTWAHAEACRAWQTDAQ